MMSNTKFIQNQSFKYPAVYVIFTLLSAVRRGIKRGNIWREFRRQKVALKPRLSFWVALCSEAGLLKIEDGLRVTGYAKTWLTKTPEEQSLHLIESWQNVPRNHKVHLFRKRLLWKFKYDKPLTQKDMKALGGLDALGLTLNGKLTKWGTFFIKNEGILPTSNCSQPCAIQGDHFIASLPQHAPHLWDLEHFLRPNAPGHYPLTKRALQFIDGDPHALADLLEHGLGKPLPPQTKAIILDQPSIRVASGIVLEFSSPAELKQLRRQPIFRKYIDEFLSPQRVLVSNDKKKGLFEMLNRRGVYLDRSTEHHQGRKKRTHFLQSKQNTILEPVGRYAPIISILEKIQDLGTSLGYSLPHTGLPCRTQAHHAIVHRRARWANICHRLLPDSPRTTHFQARPH